MTNVKEWMKKHKAEIIYGAVTVGTIALAIVGIKKLKNMKVNIPVSELTKSTNTEAVKLALDGINVVTITDEWLDGDVGEYTNMILNDFKLGDMGKIGEALINYLPNVDESTEVTGIFGILGGQD